MQSVDFRTFRFIINAKEIRSQMIIFGTWKKNPHLDSPVGFFRIIIHKNITLHCINGSLSLDIFHFSLPIFMVYCWSREKPSKVKDINMSVNWSLKIHGNRLYQFTTRNWMLNSPHAGQEKRNRGRNTVNASVDKIKLQIFTDCFERGKDRRKIYHCFYPISRRRSLYGKKDWRL